MDVTDEMAAEEVPEVNVDIPDEGAESIRSDGFGHSAEAHEARSKPFLTRPSSEAIGRTTGHTARFAVGVRSASPQVDVKTHTLEKEAEPLRMGCLWCQWITN